MIPTGILNKSACLQSIKSDICLSNHSYVRSAECLFYISSQQSPFTQVHRRLRTCASFQLHFYVLVCPCPFSTCLVSLCVPISHEVNWPSADIVKPHTLFEKHVTKVIKSITRLYLCTCRQRVYSISGPDHCWWPIPGPVPVQSSIHPRDYHQYKELW